MRVVVFGATGMVGGGVLRECLLDPAVTSVLAVGRRSTGVADPKLTEVVHGDMHDLSAIEDRLTGLDACLFCLGVSAVGYSEERYRRITNDLTLSVADTLIRLNPGLRFVYVSGQGADSTESSRTMWARVRGGTENALLARSEAAYVLRPGFIQPRNGERSAVRLYRVIYRIAGPLYPVLRRLWPGSVTTTENVGRAMLAAARSGAPKRILENRDVNALASAP